MRWLLKIGLLLLLVHIAGPGRAAEGHPDEGGVEAVYMSDGEAGVGCGSEGRAELSDNLSYYNGESSLIHVFNAEELLSFKGRWFNHQLRIAQRLMMCFRNDFLVVLQKERERCFPSVKSHHVFPPCDFYVFTLRKILV